MSRWRALAAKGIAVTPTLVTGQSVFPPTSLLHAITEDSLGRVEPRRRYLSRFAIGPAISDPARFLGIADSVGTIGPGMAADLVLLDADPLDDIGNTRRIAGIVLRGRWLDRAALDRLLESVERAEDRRVNDWSRRR